MLKTQIQFNNNQWADTEINLNDPTITNIVELDKENNIVSIFYYTGHNITIKGNYEKINSAWKDLTVLRNNKK